MLEQGWLRQQVEEVRQDMATWPIWMKIQFGKAPAPDTKKNTSEVCNETLKHFSRKGVKRMAQHRGGITNSTETCRLFPECRRQVAEEIFEEVDKWLGEPLQYGFRHFIDKLDAYKLIKARWLK